MPLKIKKEHLGTVVGFNKSGKPLGKRDDLILLYNMTARNKGLLKYFEETPTLKEAEQMMDEHFAKKKKK